MDPFENYFRNMQRTLEDLEKKAGKSSDANRDTNKPKPKEDPRVSVLIRTFNNEITKGDKPFLEEAIIDLQKEVFDNDRNADLIKAHVKAALFVNNIEVAYDSLKRLRNKNANEEQIMGMLTYSLDESLRSINWFERVKERVDSANLMYAISLARVGKTSPIQHKTILQNLMEPSPIANTILGILYFNEQETPSAIPFFQRAVDLAPHSERYQLNLLRAKIQSGKEHQVYSGMSEFYVTTGSTLSTQEVQRELAKQEIEIPKLKFKNLYKIVNKLL